MRRLFYAIRLWAWFAVRSDVRYEPFSWYLEAYDRRQATFRGEL